MNEDASRDQGRKANQRDGRGQEEIRKEEITGCSREERKESKGESVQPRACKKVN